MRGLDHKAARTLGAYILHHGGNPTVEVFVEHGRVIQERGRRLAIEALSAPCLLSASDMMGEAVDEVMKGDE